MEPLQMPTTNDSVYTLWNAVQPYNKNEIMSFATEWLQLETIMLSEISQFQKDKPVFPLNRDNW